MGRWGTQISQICTDQERVYGDAPGWLRAVCASEKSAVIRILPRRHGGTEKYKSSVEGLWS